MKRPPCEEDGIITAFRDGQVTLRSQRRIEGFTNAVHEIGYQGIRKNDLVIHAMDAFAGAIGVSDSDGKSTPVYSVCTSRTADIHVPYYGLLLRHMALSGFVNSLAKGIRERSTEFRWTDASGIFLPVPSFKEQKAITEFLAIETGKIDGLVAEQQKLIVLLKEKRQAVISHAVTKGLDPAAPMKDSGVEWLGEVPAHWGVLQLRRIIEGFEQGWSPECESRQIQGDEWGVLKAGCINGGIFDPFEHKALPSQLEPRPSLSVRDGDVLMSRASGSPTLIGSVARLVNPPPRMMLSDKIFRLTLLSEMRSDFFALVMGSMPLRGQIQRSIGGAEGLANNLSQSSIRDFWIGLPPEREQEQIAAWLTKEEHNSAALQQEVEHVITLLRQRRSALVAAAVTGKIDVRELAKAKAV